MDRQPILETERLVLRPLTETDREALHAIASDPAVWEQHPIHDRWRREVFGSDALDLVEGKLAFAVEQGKLKMTHIDDEVEG